MIMKEENMELIYQQFDGLEISFQCSVPRRILLQLNQAKKEAQVEKGDVPAKIGGTTVSVSETGARGGFTYQFSNGPDGEIWLVRDSEAADQYNVRVRVRSLCLALYGYEKTKEKILDILMKKLHAKGPEENNSIPQERISRVDYCLDFISKNEFNPSTKNFVCGGRTKKSEYLDLPAQSEGSGQYVEYIRIGKMPNRQIVIYNKTKEIKAKFKRYWFQIWGIDEKELSHEVWRIEARAGKKELNKWDVRTFDDLENKIGNVMSSILKEFEFRIPNLNDTNIKRWEVADFWLCAIKEMEINLENYISDAERNTILKGIRVQKLEQLKKLIAGCMVSLTAIEGKDISEIPGVLEGFSNELLDSVTQNPQKFRRTFEKSNNRYIGLI